MIKEAYFYPIFLFYQMLRRDPHSNTVLKIHLSDLKKIKPCVAPSSITPWHWLTVDTQGQLPYIHLLKNSYQ